MYTAINLTFITSTLFYHYRHFFLSRWIFLIASRQKAEVHLQVPHWVDKWCSNTNQYIINLSYFYSLRRYILLLFFSFFFLNLCDKENNLETNGKIGKSKWQQTWWKFFNTVNYCFLILLILLIHYRKITSHQD